QAPVLPEPQGFSLPSSKRKGCGRRLPRADADLAVGVVGAQQRLPRSFLSPVPVLPTSANPNRRGSLCADHSPVVLPARRLPRASGRFRNVSSSPRDCTCSARITVMTRPRRVEQDERTYIEQTNSCQALF